MSAFDRLQRFLVRQVEARQRAASPRRLLDFAIAVSLFGAAAMLLAAFALRAPELGLELGARLIFGLLLMVAIRPWLRA